MNFTNHCLISVPPSTLWEFLTDIPKVATCLPGVEEVDKVDDTHYKGIITQKVGVVKLRLSGKIEIETMDAAARKAVMKVEANDQRISGMIQGKLTMNLEEVSPTETRLIAGSDINLFGKIGEFGQPMIRKKADQMMAEFATNVAQKVGGTAVMQEVPSKPTSMLGI
jgi:carbon monoxide dehydrogenase subunit G